jgi:hypothetical protein
MPLADPHPSSRARGDEDCVRKETHNNHLKQRDKESTRCRVSLSLSLFRQVTQMLVVQEGVVVISWNITKTASVKQALGGVCFP